MQFNKSNPKQDKHTEYIFLKAIFIVALLAMAVQAMSQTNFIVIFADDQGCQDLGCSGSPNIKTPGIDRMAKEGSKMNSSYMLS